MVQFRIKAMETLQKMIAPGERSILSISNSYGKGAILKNGCREKNRYKDVHQQKRHLNRRIIKKRTSQI
jgi:hypothetical protein